MKKTIEKIIKIAEKNVNNYVCSNGESRRFKQGLWLLRDQGKAYPVGNGAWKVIL